MQFLEPKDQNDLNLCFISWDGANRNVLLKTSEGKIRTYYLLPLERYKMMIYQEFDTVKEAINDYDLKIGTVVALLRIKYDLILKENANQLKQDKNFMQTLGYYTALAPSSFVSRIWDQNIPIDASDLETLDRLLDEQYKTLNLHVRPLVE
ncbi:MAG: hypothetical protein HWD61_15570 [Parachlamydiaceae bacterium]|nr:MAG: hypothetical protein HWD61_15570 [Parachlamydiaceae bacterium]